MASFIPPLAPCDYHFLRRFRALILLLQAPTIVPPVDPVQVVEPIEQLVARLAAFQTRFDRFETRHDQHMEFIVTGLRELGLQALFGGAEVAVADGMDAAETDTDEAE